jgi:hypothetical protein
LTSTRIVGVDLAVNVEAFVDLDLDPASRCKVDEGVKLYVAVEDNVEGQPRRRRLMIRHKLSAMATGFSSSTKT